MGDTSAVDTGTSPATPMSLFPARFLIVTLVLSSCASEASIVRLPQPVGPGPRASADGQGWLLVRTGTRILAIGETDEILHQPYELYDVAGAHLKTVGGAVVERIALAPGRYVVRGAGPSGARIEVSVSVLDGRTTQVFLDGGWVAPAGNERAPTVRGPDGSVVGWKAE